VSFVLSLFLLWPHASAAPRQEPDVRPLETGKALERNLAGDAVHRYRLAMGAGQYVHLVVDQRGIDVMVTLLDPVGQKIAEIDSPNGTAGPEPLFAIAELAGTYALDVRSLDKTAAAGLYEVRIQELRAATTEDRSRVSGEVAFAAAALLASEGTGPSRRNAVVKYQESLVFFRTARAAGREAWTLQTLGELMRSLGDLTGSLDADTHALAIWRATGDRLGESRALNNIGVAQNRRGDKPAALENYRRAQEIQKAIGERPGEAATLNNMGSVYDDLGDSQKALQCYADAVAIYQQLGDKRGEANIVNNIGFVYLRAHDPVKALESFTRVLPLFRALGDRRSEAAVLNNIGGVYVGTGERTRTLEYWTQALAIHRSVGDRIGEATLLNNLGGVSRDLGDIPKAFDYHTQALALNRALGNRGGEASTLTNLGLLESDFGDPQQALAHFAQALPLRRAVGDPRGEAATLNNIGKVHAELGRKQEALDDFAQSLQISRNAGDRGGQATTLANMGVVYGDLGDRQRAIDSLEQALAARRAIGDRPGEAISLNDLGVLYNDLGETRTSLDHHLAALPITRAVGDKHAEASTLSRIGEVYSSMNDKPKALDYLGQGLVIFRGLGDRRSEAQTLTNIAAAHASLGDRRQALDLNAQALTLQRAVGDRSREAATLNNTGAIHDSMGDRVRAREYYTQALPLYRAVADRTGEAAVLYNLASLSRADGDPAAALTTIESVLGIAESLRSNLGSQTLRSSYFGTIRKYYDFNIAVLMELHQRTPSAGHDARAFQASEMMRARALLETLAEAQADIRQGVDPALLERQRSLLDQLNARAREQSRILSRVHTEQQAAAVAKALDELTTNLRQTEAAIRRVSPRYAELTQPKPLTLDEAKQALDSTSLLLQYSLGSQYSYLWAVTSTASASFELPARDRIETLARQYYELLTARNRHPAGESPEAWRTRIASADRDLPRVAGALSQMILGPARSWLGDKRVLVALEGALQYIPFESLPEPGANGVTANPLVLRHEVVVVPSISAVALERQTLEGRPSPAKTMAVIADPVFSDTDPRLATPTRTRPQDSGGVRPIEAIERAAGAAGVTVDGGALPRLRYSRDEAQAIVALSAPDRRLVALDFDASASLVSSGRLAEYRILHIASHAFLNGDRPELSGIALSMVDSTGAAVDGFLRLGSIFNLQLPIDMVVLSACQTALGKDAGGEGLVGLTRAFMYAGVPRVVGSLWKVDDQATSQLMTLFYQRLLGPNPLRPPAALRAAQDAMRRMPRWQSPYYWAGFVLEGEWR
jgi:CHAT domain-containing protein/Tfp pilus assembly protein PilF